MANDVQQQELQAGYTKLRNIEVPSKIHIHLWRVLNNYIPTLSNLKLRKIRSNDLCLFYNQEGETISHLFRDCLFAQEVFQLLGIEISGVDIRQEWKMWLVEIIRNNSNQQNIVLVIAIWGIWYNINKLQHEGSKSSDGEFY